MTVKPSELDFSLWSINEFTEKEKKYSIPKNTTTDYYIVTRARTHYKRLNTIKKGSTVSWVFLTTLALSIFIETQVIYYY